ncbi:MAG: hypothetical protein WBA97_36940 [Actinophytocola sp.]|uniref:hypothetical protein n=1 Tax=Actinophytocola sp. TaxID=1872138 RepID=UPI003C73C23E
MSTLTVPRSGTRTWNRPMLLLAYGMVGLALVSLAGLIFDDRLLGGMPIWTKPFKFTISIGVYAITWAWMASLTTRAPRLVRRTSLGLVGLLLLEIVLIIGQVVRGRASHFNNETEFDHRIYHVMGASITTVWLLTLVLTIVLMRSEIRDAADRWAIRLGAAISLVGAGFGPVMAFPTQAQVDTMRAGLNPAALGSHSVGVPDGGQAMPILGWSTTGGDLRIPHFLGMHALQLLPLLAIALTLFATRLPLLRSEAVRVRLVFVAAAGFAGLLTLVAWQAFRGQPLIAPDGWTLAALGLLVIGVTVGTAWACRAPADDPAQPSPAWTARQKASSASS